MPHYKPSGDHVCSGGFGLEDCRNRVNDRRKVGRGPGSLTTAFGSNKMHSSYQPIDSTDPHKL